MEKILEMFLKKLSDKLATKAFILLGVIAAVIVYDYENKILFESICAIKITISVVLVICGIYHFIIKRKVDKFIFEHNSRRLETDRYNIKCGKFEIEICHDRKPILWNGQPTITIRVINKSKESIEKFSGFIDLYFKESYVDQIRLKIDYILPGLAYKTTITKGKVTYCNWETAKFIYMENGERKICSGPFRVYIPDIDYIFIKNKTWHVIKEDLYYFRTWLECWWNGGGYRIGTWKDYIIRKIKSYFFRVVMVVVGCVVLAGVVWLGAEVFREVVAWGELHLETLER